MPNREFLKLKHQVEAMAPGKDSPAETPQISKLKRKALFWQMHLRDQGLSLEFSLTLSELSPEHALEPVGPHGHTRSSYELKWTKVGAKFCFMVTNIKAQKSLPLVQCPDYLLETILGQMDQYLQKLTTFIQTNAAYDEEYASAEDDAEKLQ